MFVRFAINSGSALVKIAKSGLSQQQLCSNSRLLTTKTMALVGNELKEVEIETDVAPFKSHLTPSSAEKIYPTAHDAYEDIPVVIDGKEIKVAREFCYPCYPIIPNFVPPNAKLAENIDVVAKGTSMAEILDVNFAENMPTIDDDKNPQRDLKNFPSDHKMLQVEEPKYRMFFFPDWWFEPFYNKTGVTGPYFAVTGISLALLSKEWLVLDHSVPAGVCFWILMFQGLKKFGPSLKDHTQASAVKTIMGWRDWQKGSVKLLHNIIEFNNNEIQASKDPSVLFNVYRENAHLQREAEYRKRVMSIYKDAKRKLDLQSALDEGKRSFAKRNMVTWILDNVNKGITPDREKNFFDQCLVDLKNLSVKRANAI